MSSDADQLLPVVYAELRELADRYVGRSGPGQTLQPTALVHEAYLKIADRTRSEFAGRTHFLAVAATAMRHILIDHARARNTLKRGADRHRVTIANVRDGAREPVDLLALDEAIEQLAELDPRQARLVEMRFFAGLSIDETAEVLDISPRSVDREWRIAKAWLSQRLSDSTAP